ncbi:MAG: hypothetical protein ACI9P5_004556 [Saprospiraceae bacterium]|jgi:hypothetical protein
MNVSHIIYKVDDLDKAVASFERKGFQVEYGSKNKPHNALIYFSEGPYIELLKNAPVPFYKKVLLNILGKRKVVERIYRWENAAEGIVDICLENCGWDFNQVERILKRYNQKYFITNSKRLDPSDRLLKWKLLFPHELRIPFLMTYFNIDPKPDKIIHPNGTKRIKSISYGITEELIPFIQELCDDEMLTLFVGNGITNLLYDQVLPDADEGQNAKRLYS